jgi:hypothetical protein
VVEHLTNGASGTRDRRRLGIIETRCRTGGRVGRYDLAINGRLSAQGNARTPQPDGSDQSARAAPSATRPHERAPLS